MSEVSAANVKELREVTGAGMMDCKKALVESGGDVEAAKEWLRKKGVAKALKKSARETKEGRVGLFISGDQKKAGLVRVACETDFVGKNEKFLELVNQLAQLAAEKGSDNFEELPLDGGTVKDRIVKAVSELGENIQFIDASSLSIDGEGVVGGYLHTNGKVGVIVALDSDKAVSGEAVEALVKDLCMHITATPAEAIRENEIDPSVLQKEKDILAAQARESGKPENIIEKMIEGRIKKFVKEVCVESQPFVKNPDQTIKQLIDEVAKGLGAQFTFRKFSKSQF